jgi:hypothetical protein
VRLCLLTAYKDCLREKCKATTKQARDLREAMKDDTKLVAITMAITSKEQIPLLIYNVEQSSRSGKFKNFRKKLVPLHLS